MRRIPGRTTAGLLTGFAAVAAALPLLAALLGVVGASQDQLRRGAVDALDSAARHVALRLQRGLAEQWRELEAMAAYAARELDQGPLQTRLDTARALNHRLAWMGVARPDGRVLAATGRVLEGQDVSARPWFAAGLHGSFAGDVHEAVLLQRHLPRRPDAEPLRLIDFAAPLRRPDGTVAAVIGSHLDWDWMRDLLRSTPLAPGLEVLLLARDGTVLIGPAGLEGTRLLTQRTGQAAVQGVAAVVEEAWPDGRRYLAALRPAAAAPGTAAAAPTVPGFGWSLVVLQPAEAAAAAERGTARRVLLPVLIACALVLAAGLALARAVGRPLAALAAAAAAVAEGRQDAPVPESRSTREAATLAAALARLDGAVRADAAAAGPPARTPPPPPHAAPRPVPFRSAA